MIDGKVEFRGRQVIAGWPEQVREAGPTAHCGRPM